MYWIDNIEPALFASLWQAAIAYLLLFFVRRSKFSSPIQTYILGTSLQFVLVSLFFFQIFSEAQPISILFNYSLSNPYWKIILTNNYISYSYILLLILNILLFIRKNIQNKRNQIQYTNKQQIHVPEQVNNLFEEWKNKLDIKRSIKLVVRESVIGPFTKGFLKPAVILPLSFVNGLKTNQMEAVLLHELWHIKRYDYVFLWIQLCLEKLLYFNPFFLLVGKAIHEDRELSCDLYSIKANNYNSIDYVESLLFFTRNNNESKAVQLSITGKRNSELLNRVTYILEGKKNRSYAVPVWTNGIAIITLIISILGINNPDKSSNISVQANNHFKSVKRSIPVIHSEQSSLAFNFPVSLPNKAVFFSNKTSERIDKKEIVKSKYKTKSSTKSESKQSLEEESTPIQPSFARLATYIQPSENASFSIVPIEISTNKALFAVRTKDADNQDQIVATLVRNIDNHFPIESTEVQYAAFSDNNQLYETYSTELKSANYNFLLIKRNSNIYIAVSPNRTEKDLF